MKKPIQYALLAIAVITVISMGAALLLHFIDLDVFRERIEKAASRAAERQIKIEGHLDVNLFPHPEVVLNNISIANADWGTEPVMARIGHIDAAINFWSLLSDTLIVRRIRLRDVTVLLEVNDKHLGNWVVGAAQSDEKSTTADVEDDPHLPLFVNSAELNDIAVTVRSNEHADQIYRIAAFTLQPHQSGNLILKSSGEVQGHPMALHGSITSKHSVIGYGAVKADLKATLLEAQVAGSLSTDDLGTLADLNGALRIEAEDVRKVLRVAQIKAPFRGPFAVDADFKKNGPRFEMTAKAEVDGITATAHASREDKQVNLESTLAPLERVAALYELQGFKAHALDLNARMAPSADGGYEIDSLKIKAGKSGLSIRGHIDGKGDALLAISLESPDLSALISNLPAVPFQAAASTHISAEKIAVSNMAVSIDKSDLNGELTLELNGKKHIAANLKSKTLDLRPFGPPAKPDAAEKSIKTKSSYVFPEALLPLARLKSIEGSLRFSANRFYYNEIVMIDAVIDAAAHNGHVNAKVRFDSDITGRAAARLGLKIQGQQAVADALVSLTDFRANVMAGNDNRPEDIPPVSLTMELNTSGASPRQMASAANGRVLITAGAGRTSNTLIKMVSNDIVDQLISKLNPFAKKDKFSNWDCTVAEVDIVDGRAGITTLLVQGEKVMIVGGGGIDLKNEHLNVEFNTKPRSGVGISADMFVTPFIKVKGTLAHPTIGLDKKGTLLTGGAAFATGGLSFLIKRLFDRATAEGDHCEKARQSVGKHNPYSF